MSRSLVFRCVLYISVLWLLCEVIDCQDIRRHDVHRIVLKSKSRNRHKKPTRQPQYNENYYNEAHIYHNEPQEHYYHDLEGQYSNHHGRYHNRYRESPKDYNRHQDHRFNYNDYNVNDYRHTDYSNNEYYHNGNDFNMNKYHPYSDHYNNNNFQTQVDGYNNYRDYDRYKELMEQYNKRNEEEFKAHLEKSKHQVLPLPEEEQKHLETHPRPVTWKPPIAQYFKGEWSPMSSGETLTKDTKNHLKNLLAHDSKNIADLIEITTAKPQKLPPLITETTWKNGLSKHKMVNFNFNPNLGSTTHYNHKNSSKTAFSHQPSEFSQTKKNKIKPYQVHEDTNESLSAIPAGFPQLASAASASYKSVWKPETNSALLNHQNETVFGSRTKVKRVKRPAVMTK